MTFNQKLKGKIYLAKKIYEYYRYLRPFTTKNKLTDDPGRHPISIFSNPRGGSTWMAEMFCKLPNSILISEPMYLIPPYKEIKDVGFCFHQYIPEDAEWPEAEEYFRKLYHMEIGSFSSLRLYYHNKSLRNISSAKYFIYKEVNSNMLLPWLSGKFKINPIYLIRHPCAVIASQLKYKYWDYILKDVKAYFPPPSRYNEIYFTYKDIIAIITKPEERLAAEWALQNILLIKHPENDLRWITVSYEKIYKDPFPEFTRIFNRLGLEMPDNLLAGVKKPSITTIENSKLHIQTGKQIESWRKSLTTTQIRNIFNILKEFKVDFYDESPEPDYSKIFARHPGGTIHELSSVK